MLKSILLYSLKQRTLVVLLALATLLLGVYNFRRLPIDAVPDITNVQVQINTEAPGFSPLEVEQRVTFLIETSLAGLPRLSYTRSISRYGLSQVTVVFEDGTDIYFVRQLITERLQAIKESLPAGLEPTMGPIATGLGEIFLWTVQADKASESKYSLSDLRTIQDWIIRPQIKNVPGVTDVNSIGGYLKEFHVNPLPEKLVAYGLTFSDLVTALSRNNANVGAGYIERNGQQYLIRSTGRIVSLEQIANIVVATRRGVPIYIKDVATVSLGKELRTGAATEDGKEAILGTVFMLIGENSRTVSQRVAEKMEEINRNLPEGVEAVTVYDRTRLVNATLHTVQQNLLEGAILVVAILFLFLGNFRAALVTALIIPLSMAFAVTGMLSYGVSGNLLSLGAIDFGIIVDGAIIIVENCLRRLSEAQQRLGRVLEFSERFETIRSASLEVLQPSVFGVFIIMVIYLPILSLTGIEGKMFHPMAFTVIAALLGSMLFAITFVPATLLFLLGGRLSENENPLMRWARRLYRPILAFALRARFLVILAACGLFAATLLLASRMGSEFLPSLDEGDLLIHALRIPGTGLEQAVSMQSMLEAEISKFPEVSHVFAKIGTAEIATDPMPPSVADVYVMLKPRSDWPDPSLPKAGLVAKMEERLNQIPGNKYEFIQPIEMRFNELIAGVRSDVGVKVFGDDMATLEEVGKKIEAVLKTIPGASDVRAEQATGLPFLTIELDWKAMARYGLSAEDVQEVIQTAIGGSTAGELVEGDRRFPIIVRLSDRLRGDIQALERIPVPLPATVQGASYVPLGAVTRFELAPGPNQVNRENGKRHATITANVRGRDLGSFVLEAQGRIRDEVEIPPGYWLEWGGQFEHLLSAAKRLQIVVLISLVLIFVLLFTTLESARDATLVFTGVPLALTGGVVGLWVRGIPLSISAAVGFIALSGVAVLNGLVMVSFIKKLRFEGMPLWESVETGSLTRLRPVLMTALVASVGFIPMALSQGVGAEVQRPLATVVIGGILSSTALTLLVLPALYYTAHRKGSQEVSSHG